MLNHQKAYDRWKALEGRSSSIGIKVMWGQTQVLAIERKKYDAESVGESAYILFLRSRVFNEFSIKFKEN